MSLLLPNSTRARRAVLPPHGDDHLHFVVEFLPGQAPPRDEFEAFLNGLPGRSEIRHWLPASDSVGLRIDPPLLPALTHHPRVRRIEPDHRVVPALEPVGAALGLDFLHRAG